MIGIVDYRMGNLGSVLNACTKVGAEAKLVSAPEELKACNRLMLPGVGAFPDAMTHLRENDMDVAIREFVASGRPLMGTCLGMQLLFERSEEFGEHEGLGLIPGRVVRFDEAKFDHPLKVPHMGWNEMFVRKDSSLFEGLPREFYLYFVHSYHAVTEEKYTIGTTYYGYEFVSAVQRENVYGFQPHPEKSHDHGLKIVENFAKL
jgi:glutamine amidotransferase